LTRASSTLIPSDGSLAAALRRLPSKYSDGRGNFASFTPVILLGLASAECCAACDRSLAEDIELIAVDPAPMGAHWLPLPDGDALEVSALLAELRPLPTK